jgi:hypothetical protein
MMRHHAWLAGFALAAAPLAAQTWHWEGGLSGVGMRVRSVNNQTVQKLSGAEYGMLGQFQYGRRLSLDVGYWQGQLTPAGGVTDKRDVAEGYVLVGGRPLPWLTLQLGPHVWTYISNAGTQRWLMWEGRVHASGEILPDVTSYIGLWDVLSAKVNVSQDFSSGLGGEGGLRVRLREVPFIPERYPVRLSLGYTIERVKLGDGVRAETLDRLMLSLSIARP